MAHKDEKGFIHYSPEELAKIPSFEERSGGGGMSALQLTGAPVGTLVGATIGAGFGPVGALVGGVAGASLGGAAAAAANQLNPNRR